MRQHSFVFYVAALAAALSCSDDDGSPKTREEFCERFASAACNTEVVQACQAADAQACRASQMAFCLDRVPSTGFSSGAAEQCLEAVETAYQDADLDAAELGTVLRFEAPCHQLSSGPGEVGATCTDVSDCNAAAGVDCVRHGGATGTCQRPVVTGPGEECDAVDAVCTPGFYCDGSHCIAAESVGEPCLANEQCGTTGYCGLTSLCESRLPVRAACGFDEQCASGVCYRLATGEQVCVDRLRLSLSEPICDDLR